MPATYERKDCRLCRSTDLVRVMNFAPTPPGNQFLTLEESEQEEVTFDLYVMQSDALSAAPAARAVLERAAEGLAA